MKAIIPTGGRGTRMRPLTFSSNKHFIPVANKPLIFYPIETVASAGIKDILITYNLGNPGTLDDIKGVMGDGSRWGLNFTYVLQENPVGGLANIFQVCEEQLEGQPFVLHLGDNIFTGGIKELVSHFEKEKPDGLVPMVHHKDNTRLGVPYFDDNGRLVRYVEKPPNPPHDFAIPGLYFFQNVVFNCFKGEDAIKPSERGELEISAPFQWLIDHHYRVDVLEYKDKWLDPGKFNDWIESNQYLLDTTLESFIDETAQINGETSLENRIRIGKNCRVSKSHLRGPLIIGDNVEITDSYVGPYSAISDNCQILSSHIENSVLMKGVNIDHVSHAIDTSLIGTESKISNSKEPTAPIKLFIGEKCSIEL